LSHKKLIEHEQTEAVTLFLSTGVTVRIHKVLIFPVGILHVYISRKASVTITFVTIITFNYLTNTEMVYFCPLPVNYQGNI